MSKVLRVLDTISGVVLLLMAMLAPWMLGATTRETIWALNGLGFSSGGLWVVQRVVRWRAIADWQPPATQAGARWPIACVMGLVITLLGYVLCSALNPKASLQYSFTPGYPFASGVEINYLDPIEWLPQSRDQDRTLRAFWKYLAIALSVSVRWSTWFPIRCKSGHSERCMTSKALAGAATNPRSINSFVSSGTPGSTSGSSPKRLASTH